MSPTRDVPADRTLFGDRLIAALQRAVDRQRDLFDATGLRLHLGKVLVVLGDLSEEQIAALRGTALLPGERRGASPDAERVGEIALRRGMVTPWQVVACLKTQAEDRAAQRPHRLIGSLLLERGHLRPKDLDACTRALSRELKLKRSARMRSGEGQPGKLTSLDAVYIKAASEGRFDADEVRIGVDRVKTLSALIPEPLSLWEYLVVRGIVSPEEHLAIVAEDPEAGPRSFLIGKVLVELGFVRQAEVDQALKLRAREARAGRRRRLGELLVERKALSDAELQEALRVQRHRRHGDPEVVATRLRRRRALLGGALGAAVVVAGAWLLGPTIRYRLAVSTLESPRASAQSRLEALARVAAAGTRESRMVIAGVLDDGTAPLELRVRSLAVLVESGDLPVVALAQALASDGPGLRATAAWALGERPQQPLGPVLAGPLQALADDPEAAVRLAAARALAVHGDATGRRLLVAAVAPEAPAVEALAERLQRPEQDVVGAVVAALERLSGFKLGADPARWRLWLELQPAADALAQDSGLQSGAQLATLLRSADPGIRFVAARALAHRGDGRGTGLLIRALDPNDDLFRDALVRRGQDPDALRPEVAGLLTLLTGEERGLDHAAWWAWWLEQRGGD